MSGWEHIICTVHVDTVHSVQCRDQPKNYCTMAENQARQPHTENVLSHTYPWCTDSYTLFVPQFFCNGNSVAS